MPVTTSEGSFELEHARSPHAGVATLPAPKESGALAIHVEARPDMGETARLLDRSFAHGYQRGARYLAWHYRDAARHPAIVVAATKGGKKIGQMVVVPHEFDVAGRTRRFGLVIDFCILPEHRSGTLTIKLCRKTADFAIEAGLDGLYGVPNAVSMGITPRLLKGKLVRKLGIRVGLAWPASSRGTFSAHADELGDSEMSAILHRYTLSAEGARRWDAQSLLRRLRSPSTRFALSASDAALAISCRQAIRGYDFTMLCGFLPAAGKRIGAASMRALIAAAARTHGHAKFCYVGLNDTLERLPGFPVPERWHPSPMTLIARTFAAGEPELTPGRYELIDFDLV